MFMRFLARLFKLFRYKTGVITVDQKSAGLIICRNIKELRDICENINNSPLTQEEIDQQMRK